MLNELKRVEKPKSQTVVVLEPLAVEEFLTLGDGLDDGDNREVTYSYRGKTVKVTGIPEDFRVFLDKMLVCECVYDNVYNVNEELAKELLD